MLSDQLFDVLGDFPLDLISDRGSPKQLGAFGSRENAEGFLGRLKAQAEWLTLQVFPRDGLFRVQAGPYVDQNEARQMADRLSQALGIKPMVLTR